MKQFQWLCKILVILALSSLSASAYAQTNNQVSMLKHMFHYMVEKKNIRLMPAYYNQAFILRANGKSLNYRQFYQIHQRAYQTAIQYRISYDQNTWITQGNKTAVRMFIKVKPAHHAWKNLEVMMIVQFRQGKIIRMWELTYPSWTQMKSLQPRTPHSRQLQPPHSRQQPRHTRPRHNQDMHV